MQLLLERKAVLARKDAENVVFIGDALLLEDLPDAQRRLLFQLENFVQILSADHPLFEQQLTKRLFHLFFR